MHVLTSQRSNINMSILLLLFSVLIIVCTHTANASSIDLAPETTGLESRKSFQTGSNFFDDAQISGGAYYYLRDRKRYSIEKKRYETIFNHGSLQTNADFVSGFVGDVLGFDFGVFASHDTFNNGATDHEAGFEPWGNPWHPDWSKKSTKDGMSIYKAALKAKAGPVWAKAGFFQPSGPGVIGVNWVFAPGTYRGVNIGADFERLSVAVAWADEYKAPWFFNFNEFRKNDGETLVPWLWSAGAKYTFDNGFSVEAAYGATKGHISNMHLKTGYVTEYAGGNLTLGYHLYGIGDSDNSGKTVNDNIDGFATQHYVFARYEYGLWKTRLEGMYTRAPASNSNNLGVFVYRLTDKSGGSSGAYESWWDARSDWNADNEKAFFVGVERKLDDLLPLSGFYTGVGAAMGVDGRGYDTAEYLKEWAFTFDFGYNKLDGMFKDAYVQLHCTLYRNGTNKPTYTAYKNGIQSEREVRLLIGIPFSL